MGFISKAAWNCFGLIQPVMQTCIAPQGGCSTNCDECYMPLVNSSGTATRYPQRCVVTVSANMSWPVHSGAFGVIPECGMCSDCAVGAGTFLLKLQRSGLQYDIDTSVRWEYSTPEPAAGPFTFAGGTDGECSVPVGETEGCFFSGPAVTFGVGYSCLTNEEPEGGRGGSVFVWYDTATQLWYGYIGVGGYGPMIPEASVPLGPGIAVNTLCEVGPQNGLVLPGGWVSPTVQGSGQQFDRIAPPFAASTRTCSGTISAAVSFYDWVERPFPTRA